jgi:hypothetical protein
MCLFREKLECVERRVVESLQDKDAALKRMAGWRC